MIWLSIRRPEARAAFGDDTVYMERYLGQPRHIEVQVIADSHGNVVHLGERECSRRAPSKIIRSPSPALTEEMRDKIGTIAAEATRKMGYLGVGTMEFLFEDVFFFIEMNTRLQVTRNTGLIWCVNKFARADIRYHSAKKILPLPAMPLNAVSMLNILRHLCRPPAR